MAMWLRKEVLGYVIERHTYIGTATLVQFKEVLCRKRSPIP